MRKFLPWLLLLVSCTPSPKDSAPPPSDGAIILEKPTELIELTEAPHWVYQQVLSIHTTTEALDASLTGRTLADFDKTKEAGYELLHHREEIKRPQMYADYQGFDAALLATLMAYTLSDAEINNLHYYGLTSPDTLAGQLLMSWLIMYPPVDFFGAWYPDIAYAGNGFWSEFFTRYYGSAEFTKKMDTSGMTWLEMIERMTEEWQENDLSVWWFWTDFEVARQKTRDIRHALLLAQLMEDYQAKRPLPPKLYEALANFLAYHQIAVGFPSYFDDYQPKQNREWWPTASGAPTFIDMNISYHLIDKYNLSNPNTIPGQLLAIQFIDYIHWFEWDGYLDALKGLLGSQQFIEQRLRYSHQEKETYLKEVENLYKMMEEVDYRWRGGEGDPATILYLARLADKHPLYQQAMRLTRVMPSVESHSNHLVLEEIDWNNRYYVAVQHREKLGYPADYADYRGYDARVVDVMMQNVFSAKEIAMLKEMDLTSPDTIPGLLLIGWMLREQSAEHFHAWYPDIPLALSPDNFWTEALTRIYGSRTFVEENKWFNELDGGAWLALLETLENTTSEEEGYFSEHEMYWYAINFRRDLYKMAEERRLMLLRDLLSRETIENERVNEALIQVLAYHNEHIGFASYYDDFVLTEKNMKYSSSLVEQLGIFRSIEHSRYIDFADYGSSHLSGFGSWEFTYHIAKMEMSEATKKDYYNKDYSNDYPFTHDIYELSAGLERTLNPYYTLLEELYTAVLEEGYR